MKAHHRRQESLMIPAGQMVEVQLHLRPLLEAKEAIGHKIYKVIRELDAAVALGRVEEEDLDLVDGLARDLRRLSIRLYDGAYRGNLGNISSPRAANSRALASEISQDFQKILVDVSGSGTLISLSPSIRKVLPSPSRMKGKPVSESSMKMVLSTETPPSGFSISSRKGAGKPKVVLGNTTKLYTQRHGAVPAHYALVEARRLKPSHDPLRSMDRVRSILWGLVCPRCGPRRWAIEIRPLEPRCPRTRREPDLAQAFSRTSPIGFVWPR